MERAMQTQVWNFSAEMKVEKNVLDSPRADNKSKSGNSSLFVKPEARSTHTGSLAAIADNEPGSPTRVPNLGEVSLGVIFRYI